MKIIVSIDTSSIKDINQITLYRNGAWIDYQDSDNLKYLFEMMLDNEFDEEIFVDEIIEDFNRYSGINEFNLSLSVFLSRLYKSFIEILKAHINNYTDYQYRVLKVANSAILLEYAKEGIYENIIPYTKFK